MGGTSAYNCRIISLTWTNKGGGRSRVGLFHRGTTVVIINIVLEFVYATDERYGYTLEFEHQHLIIN